MTRDNSDILFVGWGGPEGVSHYRTVLPAKTMGAEWVIFGMNGKPVCGEGTNSSHRVIVIQNCWAEWQLNIVARMKSRGSVVIFNVDDWIRGIGRRETSHGHAKLFRNNKTRSIHERIWSLCDGALVSTPWLEEKAAGLTSNIQVARNGIDPNRYTPWMNVERDMGTIIGWAGGTGHRDALRSVAKQISKVVNEGNDVSLWIVGQDESDLFDCPTYHVKWSDMYLYPAQLACFDINLAPALDNDFYRGKSQLRLYEALTLGTPSLVHPMYDELQHGVHGFIAEDEKEFTFYLEKLIEMDRTELKKNCLEKSKEVTIDERIGEWTRGIDRIYSEFR